MKAPFRFIAIVVASGLVVVAGATPSLACDKNDVACQMGDGGVDLWSRGELRKLGREQVAAVAARRPYFVYRSALLSRV
ncbi:MAG: hypothetical protein ACK5MP_08145 [Nostocoides sp.]